MKFDFNVSTDEGDSIASYHNEILTVRTDKGDSFVKLSKLKSPEIQNILNAVDMDDEVELQSLIDLLANSGSFEPKKLDKNYPAATHSEIATAKHLICALSAMCSANPDRVVDLVKDYLFSDEEAKRIKEFKEI